MSLQLYRCQTAPLWSRTAYNGAACPAFSLATSLDWQISSAVDSGARLDVKVNPPCSGKITEKLRMPSCSLWITLKAEEYPSKQLNIYDSIKNSKLTLEILCIALLRK